MILCLSFLQLFCLFLFFFGGGGGVFVPVFCYSVLLVTLALQSSIWVKRAGCKCLPDSKFLFALCGSSSLFNSLVYSV